MKKLLGYLTQALIIAAKIVVFSIVFQILLSILITMTKSPLEWYKNNISLSSKAFILYLVYVFVSVIIFYLVGRHVLRYKGKRWSNVIFAVIVFIIGTGNINIFGARGIYDIISPHFNFHDWFNFEITIGILNIGGIKNYMLTCDWIIIALSLYFGMSSELNEEGAALKRMKEDVIAKRLESNPELKYTREHELKKFTDTERNDIYGNSGRDNSRW